MIIIGFALTACCPSVESDLVCHKGIIKAVPIDNHSVKEMRWQTDYVCGVSFSDKSDYLTLPDPKETKIVDASNGTFQIINNHSYIDYTAQGEMSTQCNDLPSEHRKNGLESILIDDYDFKECKFADCPNCFVIYCNENDELTISDKTCAEYMDNPDAFTP